MDLWACPAVVTGAASGLGAETARYLAEAGAKVTVIDIDRDGVEKVAEEIGGLAIPCDVADSLSAENALATARAAHGVARVLVHCVGRGHTEPIVGADGPMPLDDFRQLVEVQVDHEDPVFELPDHRFEAPVPDPAFVDRAFPDRIHAASAACGAASIRSRTWSAARMPLTTPSSWKPFLSQAPA